MQGQLTLTNPGTTTPSPQDWGSARPGYTAGGTVGINESVSIDPVLLPGCSLTSNALTKRGAVTTADPLPASATITPGANTFEITNTVTCVSQLTLLKSVEDGPASPANWNLLADPGQGGTPFTVSGATTRSAANTFGVTPSQPYLLSEIASDPSAPLSYLLDRVERCEPQAGAPGGCSWVAVDESQAVSVGIGQHGVYRFVKPPSPRARGPAHRWPQLRRARDRRGQPRSTRATCRWPDLVAPPPSRIERLMSAPQTRSRALRARLLPFRITERATTHHLERTSTMTQTAHGEPPSAS